jgi:CubicO group peptidase (beta-lactamase class C family)
MSEKNKINCVKVSTALVLLLFFQLANAQYNFGELDQKFSSAKKELGNSAIVMIYKDGKVIYQKTLGEFTAKTQAPVASSSKWLTTALVLNFIDQGKLSLDDKVSKYIPLFSKYSKGYITIRDCLSNMTGLESDASGIKKVFSKTQYKSLEEEVTDYAMRKEIISNPGLEFRYGNIGMDIAARVIEIIGKRGFDQLMQERITRPLLMRSTNYSSLDAVDPANGALSSPNDYMNFLSMILNKGLFNGKRILSEQAINDMHVLRTNTNIIKYAPKTTEGFNYGLGEWIQETDVNGKATVISCQSLIGTWPMIDLCRGYAFLLFTNNLKESNRELVFAMKELIEQQIPSNCK